jgi:uncharacterized membrane protein
LINTAMQWQRDRIFVLLIGWCAALLCARVLRSGSLQYGFLIWNLCLAVIPLVASWALSRSSGIVAAICFAVWRVPAKRTIYRY